MEMTDAMRWHTVMCTSSATCMLFTFAWMGWSDNSNSFPPEYPVRDMTSFPMDLAYSTAFITFLEFPLPDIPKTTSFF